jgi:hypothetical protein
LLKLLAVAFQFVIVVRGGRVKSNTVRFINNKWLSASINSKLSYLLKFLSSGFGCFAVLLWFSELWSSVQGWFVKVG